MRPLAAQLYSLRESLAVDREGTLQRLADVGYRTVEAYNLLDDPAGLRAAIDAAGLTVCSTHGPLLGPDRDELADALRILGTNHIIVPWAPMEEFTNQAGIDRLAERINEAAEWAAGHGLRVGYHNHWWELAETIGGRPALEVMAARLRPDVFLEVDVYWAAVGGVDVPALLDRLGERVSFLHVKDGPATKDDPMTAVGSGVVPINDILAAAPHAVRIVELDECATDMMTALAESLNYLTELEGVR